MNTSPEPVSPRPDWRNPAHLAACGFGAGAAPVAPGTWGTLVAVPFYLLLQYLPLPWYLAVTAAAFAMGVWLCHVTARDLKVHDWSGIVWDEMVGFWVTMTAAPAGWEWIVAGFLLFRLFDIWKPWPVRVFDRHVMGGLGIMLDDLAAGLYACVVLHALAAWLK